MTRYGVKISMADGAEQAFVVTEAKGPEHAAELLLEDLRLDGITDVMVEDIFTI